MAETSLMTRRRLLSLPGAWALRASEPQNQSFPLRSIEGRLTPPDLFFVREHFSEPTVSLRTWKLRVEGRVARPLTLTLSDLLESTTTKVEAVLECAGNVAGGSAASNAVWEGVSVAQLLEQAQPQADAANLLFVGADRGRLLASSPTLPYLRLVPIAKGRDARTLVAFKLNDRLLPRHNGFPARALVPGWYAMDSVKWLERIVVLGPDETDPDYRASGMDRVYNRTVVDNNGKPAHRRLTDIQVKSAIAWPGDGASLPVGTHVVKGFAWSGASPVKAVEFSADAGRTWQSAAIEAPQQELGWVRWQIEWSARPGEFELLSRATDAAGDQQPLERDRARKDGYELNWCAPVKCAVA
jgi:DMSO/TMAO reductase YedYZ molybdopterin-dependent catalytic subunit